MSIMKNYDKPSILTFGKLLAMINTFKKEYALEGVLIKDFCAALKTKNAFSLVLTIVLQDTKVP